VFKIIEDAFKAGRLKILSATPTLAAEGTVQAIKRKMGTDYNLGFPQMAKHAHYVAAGVAPKRTMATEASR
jgi:replicative superfamily II helicase